MTVEREKLSDNLTPIQTANRNSATNVLGHLAFFPGHCRYPYERDKQFVLKNEKEISNPRLIRFFFFFSFDDAVKVEQRGMLPHTRQQTTKSLSHKMLNLRTLTHMATKWLTPANINSADDPTQGYSSTRCGRVTQHMYRLAFGASTCSLFTVNLAHCIWRGDHTLQSTSLSVTAKRRKGNHTCPCCRSAG